MADRELYPAVVLGPPSGFTVEEGDPYFDEVRRKTVQNRRKAEVGERVEVTAERLRAGVEAGQLEAVERVPAPDPEEAPVESARASWSAGAAEAIAWVEAHEDADELVAMGHFEEGRGRHKRVTVLRAIADRLDAIEREPGLPGSGVDGDNTTPPGVHMPGDQKDVQGDDEQAASEDGE